MIKLRDHLQPKYWLIAGILVFILFIILTFTICIAQPTQQWTVQTLKEYFDKRMDMRDDYMTEKFESLQLAITKQEEAYDKRFENTNEWRNTQDDLITTMKNMYLPRSEFEAWKSQVEEMKIEMAKVRNMKAGGNVVWAYLLAGVSLIIAVVSFTRNNRIKV